MYAMSNSKNPICSPQYFVSGHDINMYHDVLSLYMLTITQTRVALDF